METELKHIKAYIAEEKKAIDETNNRILFFIPGIVDRDDEIVTAQAIYDGIRDKETFAANPICLPCHQHRLDSGEPPCVGSWDINSAKIIAGGVECWLVFAVGTKLGDAYWKCYSQKHMRAVSIGYRTREEHREEINALQVSVITKIELYEISCVAVGANQGALSKLKLLFGLQNEEEEFGTTLSKSRQHKVDWLQDKKIIDEIHKENPDFEEDCNEFAMAVLGLKEDGEITETDESDCGSRFELAKAVHPQGNYEENEFVRAALTTK